MSRVYLGRDLHLGRQVAIKVIDPPEQDPERLARWLERFEREARVTAGLAHPGIVTAHRFGRFRGRPYLVLELLRGETLHERMQQGPLPVPEAIEIGTRLAAALCHAHGMGILHRDLSPRNIFLLEDGGLKVLDFGLSSPGGRGSGGGTPAWMAPEQWRSEPEDGRTDVFALGVLLYQILSGRLPFAGTDATSLRGAVLDGPPPASIADSRPGLPGPLVALVDRALCRDREPRPQAGEALDLLSQARAELSAGRASSEQPYRYLEAFTEADAPWFFGREREILRLRNLLERKGLVALVGPSGAGKTSLLRAGLVPRLEQASWQASLLRPGRDPLGALEAAIPEARGLDLLQRPGELGRRLRQAGGQRLLVVDAAEELLTLGGEPEARQAFARVLRSAAGDLKVVLALREDFLSRLLALLDLESPDDLALLVLAPPEPDALREALCRPAERLGYRLEPGLVEEMLASVEGEGAPLPLLQLALSRLWEARDPLRRLLPRTALAALGGVPGVLAAHAEEVVARLSSPSELAAARALLRALTAGTDTRRALERPILLQAWPDEAEAERVLDRLVQGRLLTVRQAEGLTLVEIAHEALIRRWDRLARWLAEDRERRVLLDRVEAAARHWEDRGHPAGLLWSGEGLDELRRLVEDPGVHLGGREHAFFVAADRLAGRSRRRRRLLTGGALMASFAVTLAALVGMQAYKAREAEAIEMAAVADQERRQAESRAMAAQAMEAAAIDNAQALGLAVQAVERSPTAEALSALQEALAQPYVVAALQGHTGLIEQIRYSPDGSRIVTASRDGSARLWTGDGKAVAELSSDGSDTFDGIFSPDSARLVTTAHDGVVRLWDRDGRSLGVLTRHPSGGSAWPGFAPDESIVVTGSFAGPVHLTRLDDRSTVVLEGHTGGVAFARVSPDGQRILTSSLDGTVRIWDRRARQRGRFDTRPGTVHPVAFSGDGRRVYIADPSGDIIEADLQLRPVQRLKGHLSEPQALVPSPAGLLLSLAADRMVRLWTADGQPGPLLSPGEVMGAFSPDGLAVASVNSQTGLDLTRTDGKRVAHMNGHVGWVRGVAFSPDGRRVASAAQDGLGLVWELDPVTRARLADRQREVALGRLDPGWPSVSRDPADRRIRTLIGENAGWLAGHMQHQRVVNQLIEGPGWVATSSWDRYIRIWRSTDGALLSTLDATSPSHALGWSPDRQEIITGSDDGVLRFWSPDGQLQDSIDTGGSRIWWLSVSTDGQKILVGDHDGGIRLYHRSGPLLRSLKVEEGPVWQVMLLEGDVILGHTSGVLYRWVPGVDEPQRFPHAVILTRSPEGDAALLSDVDGRTFLLEADGDLPTVLPGHPTIARTGAFSPDGQRILTTAGDGRARVYSRTGALLADVLVDRPQLIGGRFSPDGQRFATGSLKGEVRLFSAEGDLLQKVVRHDDIVLWTSFSPDGSRLLSWSEDGSVQVQDLDPERLLAEARARLARVPPTRPAWGGQSNRHGALR